jgi:hypothetical protein
MNISLPVSNPTPFEDSLLGSTNDLIMQPTVSTPSIEMVHEELKGGAKGKKTKKTVTKKDKKEKKVKKDKKAPTEKKRVKEIDTFKKPQLEKIAKKHDVSLKGRDGKVKTKEQLFKSLKRKNLV